MDYTSKENMVFFKDLLFSALRRWKAMIVIALILGIMLGGYQAVTGLRELRSETAAAEMQKTYEEALEEYRTEKEQHEKVVADLKVDLQNQQAYVADSLYLQLDPYDFYVSTVTVYVDTGYQINPDLTYQSPNKINALLHAYHSTLLSEPVIEQLAQIAETEPRYIRELYSVDANSDNQDITITIMFPNKAGAEALQAASIACLNDLTAEYNTSIVAHSVHTLEQSITNQIDIGLLDAQRDAEQEMIDIETDLLAAEEELNAITEPEKPEISVTSVMKKAIIFAVIGAVLGIILVIGWAWFAHIVGSRVYSVRSLESRTGVGVLGALKYTTPKNPVDQKLLYLEGRQTSDPTAHMQVLVRDVVNRCGAVKTLLLTGSRGDEARKLFAEALQTAMPDVTVCSCDSILCCAGSLDALAQADAVVLIEQCGYSRYNDVGAQRRKIADYGKSLLGCILIDG